MNINDIDTKHSSDKFYINWKYPTLNNLTKKDDLVTLINELNCNYTHDAGAIKKLIKGLKKLSWTELHGLHFFIVQTISAHRSAIKQRTQDELTIK